MRAGSSYRKIMDYLSGGGATSKELAEQLDIKLNQVRARLSELKELGVVRPMGRAHDSTAMLWELNEN